MEAKELMIGDWFQTTHPSGKIEYHKVTEVFPDLVYSGNSLIDAIEPVPLTTEILEKNGFNLNHVAQRYIDKVTELGDSKIAIYLDETFDNEGFFWNVRGTLVKKILYVHQLQHIINFLGAKIEIQL